MEGFESEETTLTSETSGSSINESIAVAVMLIFSGFSSACTLSAEFFNSGSGEGSPLIASSILTLLLG